MRVLENGRVRFEAVASLRSRLERRLSPASDAPHLARSGGQSAMTSRSRCADHGRERGAPSLSRTRR